MLCSVAPSKSDWDVLFKIVLFLRIVLFEELESIVVPAKR